MTKYQLYRCLLEFVKFRVEGRGKMKFRNAATCFTAEIIHDFQIYLKWRWLVFGCPAFIEKSCQVFCNVKAECIVPSVVKPLVEFLSVIRITEFRIQLTISNKPIEREVAGSHQGHDGIGGIFRTMGQIKLCMERIAEMQLHDYLPIIKLFFEFLQSDFIFVRLQAVCQLTAKFCNDRTLPGGCLCIVHDFLFR